MIRLENVTKYYPNSDEPAIDNMSLHIEKGEFAFVLGSSGAGKSTFLKLLLREVTADSGNVYVNGFNLKKIRQRKIPYLRRSMGAVFQDFRLINTMTAYENVAFAMRVTNVPEKQIKERVPFVLDLVGLGKKGDRYPDQLSGGEQQRVALARALVHSPQLIIADEPTGNIDPELSVEIMELLIAINSVGVTVVVVTHEHELVRRFDKRIIQIENGQVVADTKQAVAEDEIPAGEGAAAVDRLLDKKKATRAPARRKAYDSEEDESYTPTEPEDGWPDEDSEAMIAEECEPKRTAKKKKDTTDKNAQAQEATAKTQEIAAVEKEFLRKKKGTTQPQNEEAAEEIETEKKAAVKKSAGKAKKKDSTQEENTADKKENTANATAVKNDSIDATGAEKEATVDSVLSRKADAGIVQDEKETAAVARTSEKVASVKAEFAAADVKTAASPKATEQPEQKSEKKHRITNSELDELLREIGEARK